MKKAMSADINLFKCIKDNETNRWASGLFVGQPFRMSYNSIDILVSDDSKFKAGGIPRGSFLLAYYNAFENESNNEVLLLRVIDPTELPQDQEIITSIIECYKDNMQMYGGQAHNLDGYTRYHYSFSGLRCSILGCFYAKKNGEISFGADVENFYSADNYSIVKPSPEVLKFLVNYKENDTSDGDDDIKIGRVRYSSTQRFQSNEPDVPVYIQAKDFAGKRTALFGMTRTGKSNTAKKIIEAITKMSSHAKSKLDQESVANDGALQYPIGQIIFDINGEYANPNLQDRGSAIFDMFKENTVRYSTVPKEDFRVMKANFYREIEEGFFWIKNLPRITNDKAHYIGNFKTISLLKPESHEHAKMRRYDRLVAVYQCVLHRAGFKAPEGFRVKFNASSKVCLIVDPQKKLDENGTISLDLEEACAWWEKLWKKYDSAEVFKTYKSDEGNDGDENKKEWAEDDLKALLVMLTQKSSPGEGKTDRTGYLALKDAISHHTEINQMPYDEDIVRELRMGKIVIVDLSLGDENIQRKFSERITRKIFNDALDRFTKSQPSNYIQFYFEEAHNLFPRKDDVDLSQIYNRLAKEGAKLNLGLVYATQEVSSISDNILKATQNWFISHLNNQDEIRELTKYYDFGDFTASLIRFSQNTDKGFARMKTYSNAFVVPVQIDEFIVQKKIMPQNNPIAESEEHKRELFEAIWP